MSAAKRDSIKRSVESDGRGMKRKPPEPSACHGATALKRPIQFLAGKPVFLCVLLFVLVVGVFLPAINNGFTNYDDNLYVTSNPHVQGGLTRETTKWAFRSSVSGNWHPLTVLAHMLDCQMFGLKPRGHHLTGILLHALNAVLVFVVLRRMTGAAWMSLFVAVLFGLHPLRVESVAWVAERKDVLSVMFWMLTLLAYTRFVEESRSCGAKASLYYGLALASFSLGLMSKPMLVTLPCVLLLLDYWPLNRFDDKRAWTLVVEKAPFFLLAAISCVITFVVQQHSRAVAPLGAASLTARMGNALVAYVLYIGKLFWPVDLAVLYPFRTWSIKIVLLTGFLLLCFSVFAIARRRQHPYLPVGWFWFVGTLAPVIGLVQVGSQAMADRYTYVPSLGLLILLVWGAHAVTKSWRQGRIAVSVVSVVVMLLCILLTYRQIGYWKDSETLWRHTIAVTHNNYIGHNTLGTALHHKGNLDEAIGEFQKALKLDPDYADAHDNLGATLYVKGNLDGAIREFQEALKLKPDYANAHYNLGVALQNKGKADEAIAQYREVIGLNPDYVKARYNLGTALLSRGDIDEATFQFQEALIIQPDYPEAHNGLAAVLVRKGRYDEAIGQYQEALRLKPDYAEVRKNLDAVRGMKRNPTE